MKKDRVFKMFKIVMFVDSITAVLTFYEATEQEARKLARGGELAGYNTFIYDKNGKVLI